MPHDNGLLESALHAPLHAMDCIDILIGAVRDGRTRVQDSYSRDRSTPLEDFWYEGEMSLVGTYGRELDGRTIIMFRRPMQEIEPTDHPLGPGQLFVVYAKGQKQGAYSHDAPSALEVSHPDVIFYMDDILKYHGSKNRGVHSINFTAPIKPWKFTDTALHTNKIISEAVQATTQGVTEFMTSSSPATTTTTTQGNSIQAVDSSLRLCPTFFVLVIAFITMY
ncbi:hypothetical protein KIN20_011200 [Parelaphostrongylus tenuis]|uniref:DOMON domain-containing protein n=1 Tax=Parelaphostrongylus tenuis TaxID=148309 RepID=A0AAD5QPP8_PARTN|nr:hypothetical protein KIN20_011200 [Parelaphostrongylus tenuis]